ncbi:hypothetical protein L198_00294 [Cryptococcus wingfieldii CBS 7118]|uniref:Short coiled-coil protein n=1 Tax=Cryptococcus wingfieldii CBS 7118 TaxID=1295528 RepID=A0A1E3K5W1_9TREE|nr:hypothetical protein L198_00294 [Cryptococcus wingfieldii CBS 7118]ODO08564.1 hypothetical protein L198_00294 [Cryptococcus wingfieldii CBS 7118]
MSFANYGEGIGEPWATPEPSAAPEPSVESALEKEKILKDILTLRDGLRGLMVRVSEVEGENDKLAQENETLSLYVENLTRNSVVAAGNQK